MAERLFLIDGHSQLYQAYYTTQGLQSPSGKPTGASYGFTNMLQRLVREESPDYLAVVFDAKGPTFRHEAYGDYKATRKPMPEDLGGQLEDVFSILDAMGVARFAIEGYEADDVLATIARRSASDRKDIEVYLVSSDKDLKQVLTDRIRIYNSRTHKVLDAAGLVTEEGLTPAQIPDYLALVGDTSDNVPGVSGIGEKTALRLLSEFGSIEGILANLSRVYATRVRQALENGR